MPTRQSLTESMFFSSSWPSNAADQDVLLALLQASQDAGEESMRLRVADALDPLRILGLAVTILAVPLDSGLL